MANELEKAITIKDSIDKIDSGDLLTSIDFKDVLYGARHKLNFFLIL